MIHAHDGPRLDDPRPYSACGAWFLRGFIVGALSLVGFAAGAFLGTRLAPALLSGGSASPYAPLFGLLAR